MASFSFGAGNAQKLLSIPLYALGRIATLVIPRSRDEWVFGCATGIGDGALALWRATGSDLDGRATWLVANGREAEDASRLGIPWVPKRSVRGFWRTARSRVVVVTHGFGDVHRYAVSGAFIVQLWHGVPLKRIGLDSPVTTRSRILPRSAFVRRLLARMYRGATRRIRLIPAASHLARGRLESAFGLSDESVPVTGEPRTDVLSREGPEERRRAALTALAAACGRVVTRHRVLYAPTWRDGEPDPAVPDADEWARIGEVLERLDAVLYIRSHPLGAGDYAPPGGQTRVRMLGSDVAADITPLLPAFDALVTDYSSLVFDTALVPLPVVFLAPDLERYARERGFYGSYRAVAGDDVARTWTAAVAQLEAALADPQERERRLDRARGLSARVHAFHDGGSADRVYRAILTRLADEHPSVSTKGSR